MLLAIIDIGVVYKGLTLLRNRPAVASKTVTKLSRPSVSQRYDSFPTRDWRLRRDGFQARTSAAFHAHSHRDTTDGKLSIWGSLCLAPW